MFICGYVIGSDICWVRDTTCLLQFLVQLFAEQLVAEFSQLMPFPILFNNTPGPCPGKVGFNSRDCIKALKLSLWGNAEPAAILI